MKSLNIINILAGCVGRMGVDKIIYSTEVPIKEFSGVNLQDHIRKEFYYNPKLKKLFIILPQWNGKSKYILHSNLIKKLNKLGCSYLIYEFPNVLLSHYKLTRRYFKTIQDTVRSDIERLVGRYGFSKINIIGLSLGTVTALMVADDNPRVSKIILVAPGNCLAESVWEGINTQQLRKAFENQGISKKELKEYWRDLAPENNIQKLKGKDICVYLSRADEVAPYRFGKKLVELMKKIGLKPDVRENRFLGHCLSLRCFYFFPPKGI